MSTILGTARGSYIEQTITADAGSASVSISNDTKLAGCIPTSFTIDQGENYSVTQCLNGGTYMYAFGHDPSRSTCTIGYTGFLAGKDCQLTGNVVKTWTDFYATSRVSAKKDLLSAKIGNSVVRGALVGSDVNVVNNSVNLVSANFTLLLLDPIK